MPGHSLSEDQILDMAREIWATLNSADWDAYPDLHDKYVEAAQRCALIAAPADGQVQ